MAHVWIDKLQEVSECLKFTVTSPDLITSPRGGAGLKLISISL